MIAASSEMTDGMATSQRYQQWLLGNRRPCGRREAICARGTLRSFWVAGRFYDHFANHLVSFVSHAKIAVTPRLAESMTESAAWHHAARVERRDARRQQCITRLVSAPRIVGHRMA